MTRIDAVDEPLVGRAREVEQLRSCVHDAVSGVTRFALITGEAGAGKTRLAAEACVYARRAGFDVFTGRTRLDEGDRAYGPWRDVAEAMVRDRAVADPWLSVAADASYASGQPLSIAATAVDPAGHGAEKARYALFHAVGDALTSAARLRPIVVVLDDLHLADPASLQLFGYLANSLRDQRTLVIATMRDPDARARGGGSPAASTLPFGGAIARIELSPLTADDVGEYLRGMLGTAPPASIAVDLLERTGGNPLFLREIVAFAGSGADPTDWESFAGRARAVPPAIRDLATIRLQPLDTTCRDVLRCSAVVGIEFDVALVAAVAGMSPEHAIAALDRSCAAGVTQPTSDVPGQFVFSHAILREAVYDALPAGERALLHARCADALEARFAGALDRHAAEIAHHLRLASAVVDPERVVAYHRRAGDHAFAQASYEMAATHYGQAIDVREHSAPSDLDRCRLLLRKGRALAWSGGTPESQLAHQEAAELARALRAHEEFALAAMGMSEFLYAGTTNELAIMFLEEALRDQPEDDSRLRVRLLAQLARQLYFTPAAERGRRLSAEAVGIARRLADAELLGWTLSTRRLTLWGVDHLEERLVVTDEMVEIGAAARIAGISLQAHYWRFMDQMEAADITAARRELAAFSDLCSFTRVPADIWERENFRAALTLLEGKIDEAERIGQGALSLGQSAGDPDAGQFFAVLLFAIRREQDRLGELEAGVREFVRLFPALPVWRCALAFVLANTGREDEARAELDLIAVDGFERIPRDNSWLTAMSLLAESCAQVGDRGRALTLYRLLLPFSGRNVVVSNGIACNGPVALSLGMLAATMKRWQEAARFFEQSLAISRGLGAPCFIARTQCEWARMLLAHGRSGDRDRVTSLLAAAARAAEPLGAAAILREVGSLAALTPPAPAQAAGPGPQLTPREREILGLIAVGKSNREISAALVLSERTVERHVTNIYTKVDVHTRAQATAFAIKHGLS